MSDGGARVEHTLTAGTFSLDGGTWAVENNVWVLGDDAECVVIDAPHDAEAIAAIIGDRRLVAVLCTHAHDDHVNAAQELAERYGAPVLLNAEDEVLWRMTYPDFDFTPLADDAVLTVAGLELQVRHTPGHAPGSVCVYVPELGVVFSGDTLFHGGPGATGRSHSDFPTIVSSIQHALLSLPPDTVVHPGHGPDTTVGAEAADVPAWLARGH